MTEMWIRSLKYTLAVILITCSLFVGSDTHATQNGLNTGAFSSASANAFTGAGASANVFTGASASANANAGAGLSALNNPSAFTGAFGETGLLSRDGRKEIRNYNNRGFPYDNNRGTKSYGTLPSANVGGLNDRRGDGGRIYNKNGERVKCKWESDDYWEKGETEEDGNECEAGDDGDDGQYRPEKYDDLSDDISELKKYELQPPLIDLQPPLIDLQPPLIELQPPLIKLQPSLIELQPPLIRKTVSTYSDSKNQEFGSSSESDFLTNTRYTGKTGNFGTTPKYEPGWNNPFANTLKPPGYNGGAASAFGTIPSSQPWNKETALNSFSSSKPAWDGGQDISASFGSTSKPITNWNTGSAAANAAASVAANAAANVAANAAANAVASAATKATASAAASAAANAAANAAAKTEANSFSSMRKSETVWNKNDGTPVASFSTTAKPAQEWNIVIYDGNSGRIPPSRKLGTPWNLGHATTSKPGVNWNTGFGSNSGSNWSSNYGATPAVGTSGKQVSGKASVTPTHIGLTKSKPLSSGVFATPPSESVIAPLGSYGSQFGAQNANTYAGAYAGASGTSGIASNTYGSASDTTPHSTQPLSASNTFGTGKRLHGGIIGTGLSSTNSAGQDSIFNSGKSRQSPTGSSLYERSEATKSNSNGNGFLKSSLNSGQAGSGSSTSRDWGIAGPRAELFTSNVGTTKSPFDYVTPILSPPSPFSGTRPNNPGQSSFNFGSSGATANAAANAAGARKSASTTTFGTSFDTQSTSGIAGTAPKYGEGLVNSGIKGSFGSTRSGYGAVPLRTNLDVGTNAWSKHSENEGKSPFAGGNSGPTSGTWPVASGIRSAGHSGIESKPLIGAQLSESSSLLGKQSISGNNPWLNKVVSGSKSVFGTSDTSSAASGSAGHSENESKILFGTQSIGNNPWLNKVVSGSKSAFGTSDISSTTGGSAGHSENESKTLISAQSTGSTSLLGKQLVGGNNPWLNKQPVTGSPFGIASETSSAAGGIKSAGHSEDESKIVIGAQSAGSNSLLGKQLVGGNNPWLNKQPASGSTSPFGIASDASSGTSGIKSKEPGSGSKTWSGTQSSGNRFGKESESGTTEEDDYSWDAQNSCSRGLKGPAKTYYPAGTESYPGDLAKWNPANPFLFGAKGDNPSDISRLWNSGTTTTAKPIGKGNPFLDRLYITPKPGYGGINGGRKPEGNNPFIESGSEQFARPSASAIASSYANVKSDSNSEGASSQNRNNGGFYSTRGNSPVGGIGSSGLGGSASGQSIASATTSGSSYANIPGGSPARPGIGIGSVSVPFGIDAGRPGLGESKTAANVHTESHAESHAEAHAESFSKASSFSNSFATSGSDNLQNGKWDPPIGGLQNPAGSNPWPPAGAQATAFASAGSWARNQPIVKG